MHMTWRIRLAICAMHHAFTSQPDATEPKCLQKEHRMNQDHGKVKREGNRRGTEEPARATRPTLTHQGTQLGNDKVEVEVV